MSKFTISESDLRVLVTLLGVLAVTLVLYVQAGAHDTRRPSLLVSSTTANTVAIALQGRHLGSAERRYLGPHADGGPETPLRYGPDGPARFMVLLFPLGTPDDSGPLARLGKAGFHVADTIDLGEGGSVTMALHEDAPGWLRLWARASAWRLRSRWSVDAAAIGLLLAAIFALISTAVRRFALPVHERPKADWRAPSGQGRLGRRELAALIVGACCIGVMSTSPVADMAPQAVAMAALPFWVMDLRALAESKRSLVDALALFDDLRGGAALDSMLDDDAVRDAVLNESHAIRSTYLVERRPPEERFRAELFAARCMGVDKQRALDALVLKDELRYRLLEAASGGGAP